MAKENAYVSQTRESDFWTLVAGDRCAMWAQGGLGFTISDLGALTERCSSWDCGIRYNRFEDAGRVVIAQ